MSGGRPAPRPARGRPRPARRRRARRRGRGTGTRCGPGRPGRRRDGRRPARRRPEPRFAPTSDLTPSAVRAGVCAASSARRRPLRAASHAALRSSAQGRRRPDRRTARRSVPSSGDRGPRRDGEHGRARRRRRPGCRGSGPGWRCGRSGCRTASTRPRDPRRVEVGDLGRGEVVGDQDAVARRCAGPAAPTSGAGHLLPDVAYVGGAGAQVRVGHARQLGLRPRARRRARRAVRPAAGAGSGVCTSSSRSASSSSIRCASKIRASSLADLLAAQDADPLDLAAYLRDRRRGSGATRRRSPRAGLVGDVDVAGRAR